MQRAVIVALTALAKDGGAEIQLLPAGAFRAWDGRPKDVRAWTLDRAAAEAVVADVAGRATPLVIDYEHQTLHASENGQPAPASGWFSKVEWREGRGLYAVDVEWTERARAMIRAGEYRFISPVFAYDATGRVTKLLHASLTNFPAVDGMAPVAARFELSEGDDPMNKELAKLLALAEGATDAQVLEAVAALKTRAATAEGEVAALKTRAETAENQVVALKAEKPDPAKYAPVEALTALRDEVAALRAQSSDREVEEVVAGGIAAAKILGKEMETWARELGKKDLAALKGFIEKQPALEALKGTQTGGTAPGGGDEGESPQVVAAKAVAYQDEMRSKGVHVSTSEAVAHVKTAAKGGK